MKAMAAPISSALAPRPNGSGLSSSFQLSSLPVRSRAFLFMSVTRRSVATGPGLMATTRMPSLALTLPSDCVKAASAALPATPQMYSGSCVSAALPTTLTITPRLRFCIKRIEGAAHVDIAEDLEVPGLAPCRLVDIEQAAAGNGAGIVHQDVDVGIIAGELVDLAAVGEVGGDRVDTNIRFLSDRRLRCGQRVGAARDDDDVAAFAGENFRGGPADALRAAGDQGRFAGKFQIHYVPRKN